jgi:hypothetical protein
VAEKIRQAALRKNVLTYPSQGCVDGLRGDHILLAPPFPFLMKSVRRSHKLCNSRSPKCLRPELG